ncbi:DUF6483 family protein [Paenibacillus sp. GCM10027627]|uniref:DUF6483 family protein n=1 Tax=unclassified Paenibacillus TaxID=185978 RepID=UPI0036342073
MFQRDYFMRLVSQMTEALGQIMGLRKEMKQQEALFVIDELLDKHFRLSSKLIRNLSDKDLIKVMTTNGLVDTDQLAAIAVLMKQEAILHGELGRESEWHALSVRSLRLFIRLSLMDAEPNIVEPRSQIAELLEQLGAYELPVPAKKLLMEWHEAQGRYDLTENVMFELLEADEMDSSEAMNTYNRLLAQSDEELAAGGLPRDEIREGMHQLIGLNKELEE